jgi:endonuclease/exonuclease/phosphatase family metal-dependent hydrolase
MNQSVAPPLTRPVAHSLHGWGLPLSAIFSLVLGLEMLRAQMTYLQFLLGDRLGWSAIQIGGLAIGFYLLTGLAAMRLKGPSLPASLMGLGVTLALSRLATQIWPWDPVGDFLLVSVGVAAFWLFVPALISSSNASLTQSPQSGWSLGFWFTLGLAVEAGSRGLFLTYDPIWQQGWEAWIYVAVSLGLFLLGVTQLVGRLALDQPYQESSLGRSLPLLAIGPFLAYQLLIGTNLARTSAESGLPLTQSLFWNMGGLLLALALLYALPMGRLVGLMALVGLLLTINPLSSQGDLIAASIGLSQTAACLLFTVGLIHLTRQREHPAAWRTGLLYAGGSLLFTLFLFLTYAPLQIALPFTQESLLYILGLALGLALLGGEGWRIGGRHRAPVQGGALLASLVVMGMASLGMLYRLNTTATPPAATSTVRIYSHNVHMGIDMGGALALEELARQIEAEQPDVIALQEITRGWVIAGGVDLAAWLSWRLGMPVYFSPAQGQQFGNALLSRYPVTRHQVYPLPPPGLLMSRSFAYHEINVGMDRPLTLINTHFHHVGRDDEIREQQSQSLVAFFQPSPLNSLIITGDLNATPQDRAVTLLIEQGLIDLINLGRLEERFTYPADQPDRQIDYILAAPDLALNRVQIIDSTVSDHRAIVAEIVLTQ